MNPVSSENPELADKVPGAPVVGRWGRFSAGLRVFSFFLSALLFLSGFLTFLAPWPILFVSLRKSLNRALWVTLANGALVALLKYSPGHAPTSLAWAVFYLGLTLSITLPATLMIRARRSLELTGLTAVLGMLFMLGLVLLGAARIHGHSPAQELQTQIQNLTTLVSERMTNEKVIPSSEQEVWIKELPKQFPSSLAVLLVLIAWANFLPILRFNPGGAREKMGLPAEIIQLWKVPEFLIWPTILCGFFLIVEIPGVTSVAVVGLNALLCLYALQGLSILTFFFRRWKLMTAIRLFGFFVAVFMFLPMLLALGFFDLWFDFRKKIRQS